MTRRCSQIQDFRSITEMFGDTSLLRTIISDLWDVCAVQALSGEHRSIERHHVYGRLSCHEGPNRSFTQPNLVLNP